MSVPDFMTFFEEVTKRMWQSSSTHGAHKGNIKQTTRGQFFLEIRSTCQWQKHHYWQSCDRGVLQT